MDKMQSEEIKRRFYDLQRQRKEAEMAAKAQRANDIGQMEYERAKRAARYMHGR